MKKPTICESAESSAAIGTSVALSSCQGQVLAWRKEQKDKEPKAQGSQRKTVPSGHARNTVLIKSQWVWWPA